MFGFALGLVVPVGLFVVLAVGPFGFVIGDEVGFGFGFELGFEGTVGNAPGFALELPVVELASVVLLLVLLPLLPVLPPVVVCANALTLNAAAPMRARLRIF